MTAPASAMPAAASSAEATAQFQQQMLAASLGNGDSAGALGSASTSSGAIDMQALLQAGGLSTQAALAGAAPATAPAASAAPANVTGKFDGLKPELLQALDAVGRELGTPIDVISGNRTYAEQSRLYDAYKNGTGNLAAPPGHSNHERGAAADAYVNGVALANVPGAAEIAAKHGLHFPVGGEAWHVERVS